MALTKFGDVSKRILYMQFKDLYPSFNTRNTSKVTDKGAKSIYQGYNRLIRRVV